MTETETVRDTAHFVTHEPRSSFSTVLREVAQLGDNGFVTPSAVVREVAYLNDDYAQSSYSLLHELAKIHGTAYPALHYEVDTRDVFYGSDEISARTVATLTAHESAIILGYANAPPSATLREVAQLGDALSWFSTGTAALREVARLSDAAYPHVTVVLHEVAQLNDHLTSLLRNVVVVREVAQLGDATAPLARVQGVLHEVAQLGDDITIVVTWGGNGALLHEVFYGEGRALPPPTGRAYTCSIITWGMSVYANYPFLTQAANYAAGQNLWRLDAVDDYGVPIRSWITTGRIDIGTAHGKRPSALYAAGSSLEPLALTVTGDVDGVLLSFDYRLDLRDQTDYRNNRAILGKGFRSRYLQFKLRAEKYTAFRLLTAEVDIAVSPRRVG